MERTVRGSVQAIISVVVELELLVKPLQERDDQTLEAVELLFQSTPGVALIPVDRLIARQAASIRAATGLGVTDAVVAATAVVSNCDAIVGNDFRFARRFGQIPYHLLAEHAET
jgi:predicted nucleic acid-binding protein